MSAPAYWGSAQGTTGLAYCGGSYSFFLKGLPRQTGPWTERRPGFSILVSAHSASSFDSFERA